MNEIKEYTKKIFEDIKHIDENDNEYWYARELMTVLEYKEWRKFNKVIQKAMEACDGSNYHILDHFVLKDKMVSIGSNTSRKIKDSRINKLKNKTNLSSSHNFIYTLRPITCDLLKNTILMPNE